MRCSPYVAQQAVENYAWLKPGEMLDGLGMAETTPGPLIMVLQFVGFMGAFRDPGGLSPMLAGTLGGLLATWVTFAPCFLWIFLGAPFIEALRGHKALNGALSAITAAVVGVVLNLAVWFAIHTIFREVVPVRSFLLSFDVPQLASVDLWALHAYDCGRSCDFPVQGRHACKHSPGAARLGSFFTSQEFYRETAWSPRGTNFPAGSDWQRNLSHQEPLYINA